MKNEHACMHGVTIAELASKYIYNNNITSSLSIFFLEWGCCHLSATRGVDFSLLPGGSHTYPMIIAIFNFCPV